MKKLAILLLIFSMLLLMTSCDIYDLITQLAGGGNGPSEDPDDNNYSEMTDSDYDQLNELFENIGENLTVKVESNNRGVILNAEYVISEDSVRYTVEQLNMLPEDADINKLPESMITEYSGEAHLNENGEIIDEGGEVILLPEGEVMSGNISFDEKNFRDGKRSADGFEGELTECDEGDLRWVSRAFLNDLPKWEGDQIFLDLLWQDAPFFLLTLRYTGDTLTDAILNNKKIK